MAALLFSMQMQDTYKLAKTLVFKYTPAAEYINKRLIADGFTVITSDPRTWKHHMNMCGEYHYTNEMMYVTSIDTQERIEFTKENLKFHVATAKEYSYGTTFYSELLNAYPKQMSLIHGILKPVTMEAILGAKEGQILFYDETLIEPNEFNLIPRLQEVIYNFLQRWTVNGFHLTEDYFTHILLSNLYAKLPAFIESIRFSNVRTPQADTFHISQYLAGFFKLDEQFDQLSHKQRIWLYFNIMYVKNNFGKQHIFDLLVEKILSDRSIPLSSYELVQNSTEQVDDLLPTPMVRESPVNLYDLNGKQRITDLEELLFIVERSARDNQKEELEEIQRINASVPYSQIGSINTKVLRSSMVDLTESKKFKLTEVLINSWIWLAANNRYVAVVPFTNAVNGETVRLRAKDAFIALMYFAVKANGGTPNAIPELQVFDMPRIPPPTYDELRGLSLRRYITRDYIEEALSDLVFPETFISIQAYKDFADKLYRRQLRHYYQWNGLHDFNARSQAERITMRIYDSQVCTLTTHPTFDHWLVDKGLNFDNLDQIAFEDMFTELLTNATGIGEDAAYSPAAIQRAMIEIMRKLSPYTVLFASNINAEPFIDLTRDVMSMSSEGYGAKQITDIIDIHPEILSMDGRHYVGPYQMDNPITFEVSTPEEEVEVIDFKIGYDMDIIWEKIDYLFMPAGLDMELEGDEVTLESLTPTNVLSGFNYPE